jgi:4-hydroxybenzoate polyprenyltransferase
MKHESATKAAPTQTRQIRDAVVLLRVPFSVFLMPIFLFAVSQSGTWSWPMLLQGFIIVHLFLYPAANAYNSYFDRDEGAIGGLASPPPVNKWVLPLSRLCDFIAITWGFLLSISFGLFLVGYALFSRAYSHQRIRLKKYPLAGFFSVIAMQGAFTFLAVWVGLGSHSVDGRALLGAFICSLFLAASYPLTQVYQHDEDRKHGDQTFSMLLGIQGTFLFAALCFSLAMGALALLFVLQGEPRLTVLALASFSPAGVYFVRWFARVRRDRRNANFGSTMAMNRYASLCLSTFFTLIILLRL